MGGDFFLNRKYTGVGEALIETKPDEREALLRTTPGGGWVDGGWALKETTHLWGDALIETTRVVGGALTETTPGEGPS